MIEGRPRVSGKSIHGALFGPKPKRSEKALLPDFLPRNSSLSNTLRTVKQQQEERDE